MTVKKARRSSPIRPSAFTERAGWDGVWVSEDGNPIRFLDTLKKD